MSDLRDCGRVGGGVSVGHAPSRMPGARKAERVVFVMLPGVHSVRFCSAFCCLLLPSPPAAAEATFANPALLTGDQSLIDVIAHELAHSWSGNLTTNRDW